MSAEVVALPQIKRPDIKSTAPPPVYAELAVTSNFSFLRGSSSAKELVRRAAELGLAGIGIADRNTVAGVVRVRTALKDLKEEELEEFGSVKTNLKIAVGSRLAFADGTPDILVYPQNRAAWSQLTQLLTVGKSRAEKGDCILFIEDLLEYAAGLNLIVMPPSRVEKDSLAALFARLRQTVLPTSIWLAAGMLYRGDDARRIKRLTEIARDALVPLIAVNDVVCHTSERRALQDVVTCIREHLTLETAGRKLEANIERHLKSPSEMARIFRRLPDAIAETLVVPAPRDQVHLHEWKPVPSGHEPRPGRAVYPGIRSNRPAYRESATADLPPAISRSNLYPATPATLGFHLEH